jgi:hypothetical protein
MGERTVPHPHRQCLGRRARLLMLGATVGVAILTISTGAAAGPASTPRPSVITAAPAPEQNPFAFLFGGMRRPSSPSSVSAYADPMQAAPDARPSEPFPRSEGSAVAYCVRLCDGRFFPIQRTAATPAEICNSFCPASPTKVFSGSSIEHAAARDGARYSDLAAAFLYRTRTVPGCSCNGKDPAGLTEVKPNEDPTLRPGDLIATETGFVAYTGGKKHADFTPINLAPGVPPETRRQLSQTRIAPRDGGTDAAAAPAGETAAGSRGSSERQAQASR